MELTVQNIYGLLIRSRLLPLDDVRTLYARWQAEARDSSTNLVRFMAWLVGNRYLTEYQANLLARGHADGFFLNDYKILDRLGKGRMAGVYKAQHQLGQVVAIKVLPPSKAKDANLLARFHREARIALKLKHPNIVRSFQTGVTGELHFLVMEYLEGETLEDVLARRGKLPPNEAVRLVFQVLHGLQHVHAQGAVHRDIKPANLMLVGSAPDTTMRATVKLLDIGLGRGLFEEGPDATVDPTLTSEGVLLGTPDYMAPEQARNPRGADIRADIYSTGCVLYHLLTGHPPFPDTNIVSQMIRHATEAPRPLREANPAIPDGLQQIVNWMLAKDPAQRYPTPERAAQALQMFLAAGMDAVAAPAEEPQLKRYLTWLEVENNKKDRGRPPSDTHPVAPALPAAVQAASEKKHEGKRHGSRHRHSSGKRRSRKEHPEALPAAAAPPVVPAAVLPVTTAPLAAAVDTAASFDVELVPLGTFSPPAARLFGVSVSRRDFVTFGIGAAAGALATFLGCLLALFSKRHFQEEDKDSSSR